MKDKEKQIEEMAQTICEFTHSIGKCDCVNSFAPNCTWKDMATSIYNAGYRKITDSVVLSKEEYEKLKYAWITDSDAYKKGSKETAEKFYEFAKAWFGDDEQNDYFEEVKNLTKSLGIEIKE